MEPQWGGFTSRLQDKEVEWTARGQGEELESPEGDQNGKGGKPLPTTPPYHPKTIGKQFRTLRKTLGKQWLGNSYWVQNGGAPGYNRAYKGLIRPLRGLIM